MTSAVEQEGEDGDTMLYSDLHDLETFQAEESSTNFKRLKKNESSLPKIEEKIKGEPSFLSPESIKAEEMQDQIDRKELTSHVEKLRAENETLKRNICTLYRTAKMEMERKDRMISSLEDEVERLSR